MAGNWVGSRRAVLVGDGAALFSSPETVAEQLGSMAETNDDV